FSGSRIKFSLTRSQLEGVKHWLPASQNPADITNASFGPVPLDIRFYCFGTYSLSFDGTSWVQTHGSTPSSGDAGTLLNHLIQASHTTADTWDVYIDIPTGINTT
ncbi:hypothetical protein, partial [Enterococcus faecium]|uniref:hypothetical protein n=1 Tax=Enterococcus faecium TaxID=1352 RepID=UPI0034E93EE5